MYFTTQKNENDVFHSFKLCVVRCVWLHLFIITSVVCLLPEFAEQRY